MNDLVQKMSRMARAAIRPLAFGLLMLLCGAGAALAQLNAYITNPGTNTLSVVNTATNTVTATIPVGGGPNWISILPGTTTAYVLSGSGVASVVDLVTHAVTAVVPVGANPVSIVFGANGAFAYVSNGGSGTVTVIDTATHAVVATLPLAGADGAGASPDGASVWVGDASGVVHVIDTATNTITATFPVGVAPNQLIFTPDGAFAYLPHAFGASCVVVNTATHAVVTSVPTGVRGIGIAVTPDGALVYQANLGSNNVSVIATATNTVVATVPVGPLPVTVAITPDGAFAYVTSLGGNNAFVIDTATQAVVATVPLGTVSFGVDIVRLPNVAPTVAADQASVTVNEGQTAANTGTVSDGNGDTATLTASVGTVVNNGDGTWSWSFATSDGPPESQTVTITAADGLGGVTSTTFSLTVNNVAPTLVSVSNNGPVVAGGAATITVTATDPAGANDPLAYQFDCDDNGTFEIGPQAGNSATCTFATAGSRTVNVRVTDGDGGVATGSTVVTVLLPPPSCANATASPSLLWPPNHKFVAVTIGGLVNPAPGALAITVTGIFQDEPVQSPGSGNTTPDATGVGTANPSVRAERDGNGDGRVYHIAFTATGGSGSCTGTVTVGVPHDQGHGGPVDQGALYNSTLP